MQHNAERNATTGRMSRRLFVLALVLSGLTLFVLPAASQTDEDALFQDPLVEGESDDTGDRDNADGTGGEGGEGGRAESDGSGDEDALFGGSVVSDGGGTDGGEYDADFSEAMLTAEETRIGGRYRFALRPTFFWDDLESLSEIEGRPDYAFDTELATQVYLDARPSADFRVYAEADVSYPFTVSPSTGSEPAREFDDIVTITELFSDFTLGDSLFLRGGKHTVTWGVGYFFSPADIINLERIDPENPEADREGPVNVKAQLPIGTTNLYLYLLPPVRDQEYPAVAPKTEVVVGPFEVGLGGFWRHEEDPAAMLTAEGTLGDFSLFGEAVLLAGTDRSYVREVTPTFANPLGVETYTKDEAVFKGTAGARYGYSDVEGRINLNATAQYFYNGEGYEDPDILSENRPAVLQLIGTGRLSSADLAQPGRHYGALSAGLRNILESDVSFQALWYADLVDTTGQLSTSLSYRFTDDLSATIGANYLYGEVGDELTPTGQRLGFEVSFDIGSGRF
jgi:hypothetical protein